MGLTEWLLGKPAESWNDEGDALDKLGRYEEAIKCYNKTLELNPKYVHAWIGKGNALNKLGRYEEAIECYGKALKIYPNNQMALDNESDALYKLGRYTEAIMIGDIAFKLAIELNPKYVHSWTSKGLALNRLGRYEEAIKYCDEILELNPKDAVTWNNKGFALNRLGKYEEAIRCYDKALENRPCFKEDRSLDISYKFLGALNGKEDALVELDRIKEEQKHRLKIEDERREQQRMEEEHQKQELKREEKGKVRKEKETKKHEEERNQKKEQQNKTLPTIESPSYLSLERSIYEPVRRDFIISIQRPLPNVLDWIEKNDPLMYWLVICVNNNSDKSIDEWGIELETPATLKILDARIEGTEHGFNVNKSFSKPWLTNWILGVPHHQGIVIPRNGSKRIYFKLGSDACGVSYYIKGKVSTSDCEIPIKEKHFKYSCDTATLKVALRTNPEEAEKYAQTVISSSHNKDIALKLLHSFRIMQEIDRCCIPNQYGEIKFNDKGYNEIRDKLQILIGALESAHVGDNLIRIVKEDLDKISITKDAHASADRIRKLCGNLPDMWINEVLRV